jgi:hypothetical protein
MSFMDKIKWFGLRKLYWITRAALWTLYEKVIDRNLFITSHHQSLIKRPISRTLVHTYNGDEGQNVNFTQYFLGFGLIHYAITRNIKPTRILCVGSRRGFIPAILALSCKDNGKGHVDFVDAGYDEADPSKNWSGIGFWKKNNPANHFAKLNVTSYITTHVMTTKQFARMHPKRTYQYVYIDGDHSFEGVTLDYKLFWPKLKTGGFMVFHDIVAKGYLDKGLFGVWKLWRNLNSKHTIQFSFPKTSGLGIIQK